ncbi:MAG: hypothetical protein ACTSP4_12220 [Candidatus Hodarchaeales archaeon]
MTDSTSTEQTKVETGPVDFSEYYRDRIIVKKEILFARTLLHRKSAVRFSDNTDFIKGAAILAGLLHALKAKPSSGNWGELPIIITLQLKKHMASMLKGLREYLTLEKDRIAFLEDTRKEFTGISDKTPPIMVASVPDLTKWIVSFSRTISSSPSPWFHLLVPVTGRNSEKFATDLENIMDQIKSRSNRKIRPGFTLVISSSTGIKTIEGMIDSCKLKEIMDYPHQELDRTDTGGNKASNNETRSRTLLTKKEVMLPDVYRQMTAITASTAEKLKNKLESSGIDLQQKNWFSIGSITRLLADMRKKPAFYTSEHRITAGYLLRLVHIHEKIKTNPASELLGMFKTLKEPGAKGSKFLQLAGMEELQSLLVGQSGEIHPLTAAVLRECIDNVNNRKKTAIVAKSPVILDSLATLCKNAEIAVASLVGSYHPKKGGEDGYSEMSTKACKIAAREFYQGSAMLLFLPYNRLRFIEVTDGVDAVIFHDFSRSGKEVKKLVKRIEDCGSTAIKKIQLFFVKNSLAEDSFWSIQGKKSRRTGTTLRKQYKKKINDIDSHGNLSQPVVEKKDVSDSCVKHSSIKIPASWNYRNLTRYLGKLDYLVSFTKDNFFTFIHQDRKLTMAITTASTLMEAGFIRNFSRSYKNHVKGNREVKKELKQQKWLIINRDHHPGEEIVHNTERFYAIYISLREKPVHGFKLVSVLNNQEIQQILIILIKLFLN